IDVVADIGEDFLASRVGDGHLDLADGRCLGGAVDVGVDGDILTLHDALVAIGLVGGGDIVSHGRLTRLRHENVGVVDLAAGGSILGGSLEHLIPGALHSGGILHGDHRTVGRALLHADAVGMGIAVIQRDPGGIRTGDVVLPGGVVGDLLPGNGVVGVVLQQGDDGVILAVQRVDAGQVQGDILFVLQEAAVHPSHQAVLDRSRGGVGLSLILLGASQHHGGVDGDRVVHGGGAFGAGDVEELL